MSTTNPDRADAMRTVAWYLTQRDRTPTADRPDAEIDAAEIVHALMVRGWRRTAARPALPWEPDPQSSTPANPETVRTVAAQARAALKENHTDD